MTIGAPGTSKVCPTCGASYDEGTYFCVADGMRLRSGQRGTPRQGTATYTPRETAELSRAVAKARAKASGPSGDPDGAPDPPAPPAAPRATPGRPHVFICDDSELFLSLTTSALEDMGVKVTAARTGTEALTMAPGLRPTLMLMDVELPDGTGDEFASRLGATSLNGVPIYLYSSLSDAALAVRARQSGCAGFISKQRGVHAMMYSVRSILTKMGALK